MKLRSKFLLSVIAVMLITLLIVLLCLLLGRANHAVRLHQQALLANSKLIKNIINNKGKKEYVEAEIKDICVKMQDSGLLDKNWVVVDNSGVFVAGNKDVSVSSYQTISSRINLDNNSAYFMHSTLDKAALFSEISEGMQSIIIGMIAGTIFLISVVYVLTSRLVLDPVLRLLSMTKVLKGGGIPGDSRLTSRKDEIGELMNSFYMMAKEVVEHRKGLEEKVAEITEKISLAQKELAFKDRLSATGKLASGVAHEINNPLSGIINAVERIKKGGLDSEREKEYFELISEGLDRIKTIVSRILAYARKEPVIAPQNPIVPLKKAIDFCRHDIEKKKIRLIEDYKIQEILVEADSGELQQVFLNLLTNSIDALEYKGDDAEIKIIAEGAEEGAKFIIEDNGEGMDSDLINRSFELFHTTKPAGKGTGLGLSISNDIISRTGGSLRLESEKGKGTKAIIILPFARGN